MGSALALAVHPAASPGESIAPAPGVIPDSGSPAFSESILLQTCSFLDKQFDLVIQASFLAGFAFGEERPSRCPNPRKGLLGLELCFWDHPLLPLPPSEHSFSPFSFILLASPKGTALSAAVSRCRPAVAMGEAGGAEATVIRLLPQTSLLQGLWVLKMGCFSSFFPASARWEPPAAVLCCFSPFLW